MRTFKPSLSSAFQGFIEYSERGIVVVHCKLIVAGVTLSGAGREPFTEELLKEKRRLCALRACRCKNLQGRKIELACQHEFRIQGNSGGFGEWTPRFYAGAPFCGGT